MWEYGTGLVDTVWHRGVFYRRLLLIVCYTRVVFLIVCHRRRSLSNCTKELGFSGGSPFHPSLSGRHYRMSVSLQYLCTF